MSTYSNAHAKVQKWILIFSSLGIGLSLVSLKMIFEALESELFRFTFHLLSSKILKCPGFTLWIAKNKIAIHSIILGRRIMTIWFWQSRVDSGEVFHRLTLGQIGLILYQGKQNLKTLKTFISYNTYVGPIKHVSTSTSSQGPPNIKQLISSEQS